MHANNPNDISDELYALARGPSRRAARYSACISRGSRYHTLDRDCYRKTQNSGVLVEGSHDGENIDFYGVIVDIIGMKYLGELAVYLFKCDWWDLSNPRTGVRDDEYFLSVNTSKKWYEDDPFILASQASQVFYLDDPKLGNQWRVVQKYSPRNIYDVIPQVEGQDEEEDDSSTQEAYQESQPALNLFVDLSQYEMIPLNREDIEAEIVDATVEENVESSEVSTDDESELSNETDTDSD